MSDDIKNTLETKVLLDLKIIARKLKIKKYNKLRKDKLISDILKCDEKLIRRNLSITWWDRYHSHVYGIATIIGLFLTAIGLLLTAKSISYQNIDSEKPIQDNNDTIVWKNVILTGEVKDEDSNQPIKKAIITVVNHNVLANSDSKGLFNVKITSFTDDIINLKIWHPEYESKTIDRLINSEKEQFDITLKKRSN